MLIMGLMGPSENIFYKKWQISRDLPSNIRNLKLYQFFQRGKMRIEQPRIYSSRIQGVMIIYIVTYTPP